MDQCTQKSYLEPTEQAGRAFFSCPDNGPILMLNLMRFRDVADYVDRPDLAPEMPIKGSTAFQLYIEQTLPLLKKIGGDLLFYGATDEFLIGPADESWDAVMLVRQNSRSSFLAFASNPSYQDNLAHRTAALRDARLLPIFPTAGVCR